MMIWGKRGNKRKKKQQEFFSSLSSICFINNFNRNKIILEGKVLELSSCTEGVTNLNRYYTSILSVIIQRHLCLILCQKEFQGCFPKPVLLLHKNTASHGVLCKLAVSHVEVTFSRENA